MLIRSLSTVLVAWSSPGQSRTAASSSCGRTRAQPPNSQASWQLRPLQLARQQGIQLSCQQGVQLILLLFLLRGLTRLLAFLNMLSIVLCLVPVVDIDGDVLQPSNAWGSARAQAAAMQAHAAV